jgi:hypothetical protein
MPHRFSFLVCRFSPIIEADFLFLLLAQQTCVYHRTMKTFDGKRRNLKYFKRSPKKVTNWFVLFDEIPPCEIFLGCFTFVAAVHCVVSIFNFFYDLTLLTLKQKRD